MLHWHLTRLQPLLRDNAVQIGCRPQSRGHCLLNKLYKCPAICYLPPYHPVFVNVQMLKCGLKLSAFCFHRLFHRCAFCCFTDSIRTSSMYSHYMKCILKKDCFVKKIVLDFRRQRRKLEVSKLSYVPPGVARSTVTVTVW